METERENQKFTDEEIVFMKEKLVMHSKLFEFDARNQSFFLEAMGIYLDKESIRTMFDIAADTRVLIKVLTEEPGLVFETRSELAINVAITACDYKKLVGFKKQMGLNIIRKLDKELAFVKQKNEAQRLAQEAEEEGLEE